MKRKIAEVKTDYICDDRYQHIDIFFTDDDMEEGTTGAVVCLDTSKVFYKDNIYRNEPLVDEAIAGIRNSIFEESQKITMNTTLYSINTTLQDIVDNNEDLKAKFETLNDTEKEAFAKEHFHSAKMGFEFGLADPVSEVMSTIADNINE